MIVFQLTFGAYSWQKKIKNSLVRLAGEWKGITCKTFYEHNISYYYISRSLSMSLIHINVICTVIWTVQLIVNTSFAFITLGSESYYLTWFHSLCLFFTSLAFSSHKLLLVPVHIYSHTSLNCKGEQSRLNFLPVLDLALWLERQSTMKEMCV